MLPDLYRALHAFKSAFSRQQSWLLFCAILLSFLAAAEMGGVSPRCDATGYRTGRATIGCSIFFRAKSYQLEALHLTWHRWVLGQGRAVEVAKRLVLLGDDHTHAVKDGGRIPCRGTSAGSGVAAGNLRDPKQAQLLPWAVLGCGGRAGGNVSASFCLPLCLQIHQGFQHLREAASVLKLGERVVQMAVDFATAHDRPSWLVLDAFFATGPVFRRAQSVLSATLRQPFVQTITRAKKNYIAYCPAAST